MERLRNNKPYTLDYSDLTINIYFDIKIQSEPNPTLEVYDDLVKQFESDVEVIAIPYWNYYLYSDMASIQTNIHPTPLYDLLNEFKHEAAGRLHSLSKACSSNTKLSEVCALTNIFRS